MTRFKDFYPHLTRTALAEVSATWPLEGGLPAGLQALFQLLEQIALAEVGPWGQELTKAQVDNLCHHFNRAPNSRVLLAIALILLYRRDRRTNQVLLLSMHHMPIQGELDFLRSIWDDQRIHDFLTADTAWINAYMEETPLPPLLTFVIDQLRRNALGFDQLEGDFAQVTPLFEALLDYIFTDGREMIAKINPKLAAEIAIENLRKGRDTKTLTYINFYPESFWKPEFLDALYQFKGVPDPGTSPFYAQLPKGRIWGLRKHMFEHKLSGTRFTKDRQLFWTQWVHRIRDWRERDGDVQITIGPYLIQESPGKSTFLSVQDPSRTLETIPLDHTWERRMEEHLTEVLQWGEV